MDEPVEYRDVPGFPGYRVGNDGSVWTCRERGEPGGRGLHRLGVNWRRLSLQKSYSGYLSIRLRSRGRQKHFRVNRLVLLAFVGPCPPGMESCHENRNRADNRLTNLRWDTSAANANDKRRHGTTSQGERNVKHKLTEADVLAMRDKRLRTGVTYEELGREYNVTKSTARKAVVGEQWGHVA